MVLKHRGYGAFIKCVGTPLEEFLVKNEDERTISCYVCSEVGKNFQIHYEDYGLLEHDATAASVKGKLSKKIAIYVDGKLTRAGNSDYGKRGLFEGSRSSIEEINLYMFQDREATDDDNVAPAHSDVGCIEVCFTRTLGCIPYDQPAESFGPLEVTALHEKSKKMSLHCVGAGDVVKKTKAPWKSIPYDTSVYVKFRFYYRKRDILQAQGIVPSPVIMPASPRQSVSIKREYESNGEIDHGSEDSDTQDDKEFNDLEENYEKAKLELAKAKLELAKAAMEIAKTKLDRARERSNSNTKRRRKKAKKS